MNLADQGEEEEEQYWGQQFCQMGRVRNERIGQKGPFTKMVPNIAVGPNRKGPFH